MTSFVIYFMCGDGEIRTPEGFYTLLPFQGSALDRYATPPDIKSLKALPPL